MPVAICFLQEVGGKPPAKNRAGELELTHSELATKIVKGL